MLLGSRGIRDVPYTGDRSVDVVGRSSRWSGWAASSSVSSCGRRAASPWRCCSRSGRPRWRAWCTGSSGASAGKPTLLDPTLFASKLFSVGVSQIFLQQVVGDADRPPDLQLVWGYNALEAGITLAPLSLTMFESRSSQEESREAAAERHRPRGLRAARGVDRHPHPAGAQGGLGLAPGDPADALGRRARLLASQLNNYALAPISEERVGEAAGVTSATGSFGLSFGLAFAGAIMLATLSIAFTNMAESSTVLPPADQQRVAEVLEDDAQVMSDAQLEELLAGQPAAIQDEILSINTDARHLALQVALLVALVSRSSASSTRSA